LKAFAQVFLDKVLGCKPKTNDKQRHVIKVARGTEVS
jgi:hypothetical protein